MRLHFIEFVGTTVQVAVSFPRKSTLTTSVSETAQVHLARTKFSLLLVSIRIRNVLMMTAQLRVDDTMIGMALETRLVTS